ncbi:hypothetical protein ACHAXS_001297, partial [Conticribra weissflogii]
RQEQPSQPQPQEQQPPQPQQPQPQPQSPQPPDEPYELLPAPALLSRLLSLSADYPSFVTLTTAQERFGLPRAGTSSDCPHDAALYPSSHGDGCNVYVLIVHDKEAHPDDSDVRSGDASLEDGDAKSGWKYIPDVFLSGSVHGDERVGPTAILEAVELLVESAHCESLPRRRRGDQRDFHDDPDREDELVAARSCRRSLADRGVSPPLRRWLARLVATRRTVVVPTANALGYARNERTEDGIDPNRDFPFDVLPKNRDECMRTVAGRTVNELFRSHLFPIGLTFHGGMEVVAYEWGAPTYLNYAAPDALAQNAIAGAYSRYAAGFPGHAPYDYGTMNDKVYYVRGGMEDWAFAGSWDPDRVVECAPATFGGDYPPEKTRYNNSTLRAFNMLVETSDVKNPPGNTLGTRTRPLVAGSGDENGHVARNMRLALLAMDVVEPYVSVHEVEDLPFEDDDVIPSVNLRRHDGKSYFENARMVWVPRSRKRYRIAWTVGGAFDIDATEIVFGPWEALPENLADDGDGFYPSDQTLEQLFSSQFTVVSPTNIDARHTGRSRWHERGPFPTSQSQDILGPFYETTIDASTHPPGTPLAVFARAKVDRAWSTTPAPNVRPANLGPTSHLVNARTNPSYFASNAGKIVRGRRDNWWYSAPVTLILGSDEEGLRLAAEAAADHATVSSFDGRARAVWINSRWGGVPTAMEAVVSRRPFRTAALRLPGSSSGSIGPWIVVGMVTVALGALGWVMVRRRRGMYLDRKRVEQEMEEDDEGFSVEISEGGGGYRDDVNTSLESIHID